MEQRVVKQEQAEERG